MRYVFSLLLAATILTGCGAPESAPLHGEWEATDRPMFITFGADGSLKLRVEGDDPFSKRGTYAVDFSHDPAHLDLNFSDRELKTIVEVAGDELALENIISSRDRPTEFGEDRIDFVRVVPE